MNEELRFWLGVIFIIALSIVSIIAISTDGYTKRMKVYVENGYCETVLPGSTGVHMQKCDRVK